MSNPNHSNHGSLTTSLWLQCGTEIPIKVVFEPYIAVAEFFGDRVVVSDMVMEPWFASAKQTPTCLSYVGFICDLQTMLASGKSGLQSYSVNSKWYWKALIMNLKIKSVFVSHVHCYYKKHCAEYIKRNVILEVKICCCLGPWHMPHPPPPISGTFRAAWGLLDATLTTGIYWLLLNHTINSVLCSLGSLSHCKVRTHTHTHPHTQWALRPFY